MRKGQRIRVRASDRAARDWGVAVGAEGIVLCNYRLLAPWRNARECVDVKFSPGIIVWGAPATAFEVVSECPQARGA